MSLLKTFMKVVSTGYTILCTSYTIKISTESANCKNWSIFNLTHWSRGIQKLAFSVFHSKFETVFLKNWKKNNFFSNILANSTEMHYQYGLKTQENISPILTLRALSENSRTVVYSQTCYLLNPYFWARNRTVYKSYLQCTIITWTWSKTHSSRSFEKTLNFWLADGKSKFRGYHWLPRFRTHIATGYHWLR